MLGLYNRLNWNLSFRGSYVARTINTNVGSMLIDSIPPIEVSLKSPLIAVGIGSEKAKPTWYKAGWINLVLPFTPSSTGKFPARVDPGRDRQVLRLGYYNLIDFTYWGIANYSAQINFPYYFADAYVEIWEYSENTEGIFRPASTDPYSQSDDLKAIRAFAENRDFDVIFRQSNG